MPTWTLTEIEQALHASWSADTCSPDDVARAPWSADNPARGHCDITALVVHDLFGGVLVCAEVSSASGDPQGYHWSNELPSGITLDLTASQFRRGEVVTGGRKVPRPPGTPRIRGAEYELLRSRVAERLGPLPQAGR